MHDVCAPFSGKKITMLGLGLLGRGVGDAEFFAKCGAELIVTDKKDTKELVPSIAKLEHYTNITFHLGGHQLADFRGRDMVLKAAGVRLDSPEIAAARAAGVPVVMSTALFAKYAQELGVTLIGVTGTRGKSTIAHLIHHTLSRMDRRSHLGGNIRGVSTLAKLLEVKRGDYAMLELDSWQLQGFGDLKISPHVAIFTNIMPDHLNYYPDMETYFADKANIFRFQKSGDTLLCSLSIARQIAEAHPPVPPLTPAPIPGNWQLKIAGEHNRENAALAAGALSALGLSEDEIKAGFESFEAVEGRLQLVAEINNVKIYNDNNSTTPDATIAALRALHGGTKNIVLIMGGADKGLDVGPLLAEMDRTCKKVILLAGTGTDHIKHVLEESHVYDTLEAAFIAARQEVQPGDVLLFSPGFASFGMFANEYDRNDRFMALVRQSL